MIIRNFTKQPLSVTLIISIIIDKKNPIYHNGNVNNTAAEEQTNFDPPYCNTIKLGGEQSYQWQERRGGRWQQ